jgi:hypothetical protein
VRLSDAQGHMTSESLLGKDQILHLALETFCEMTLNHQPG